MRPVKHAPSRTGTRSVPRKGAAKNSSAVRRNNLANARKRQFSSDIALLRFIEDVKNRAFKIPPLLVATVVLFVGLGAYGLFVGGHVAAAVASVGHQGNRLLAMTGFSVQEVTVKGRSHADAKALVDALGISQGDPIFGLDTDGARERIEQLDWVKTATVTRLLPDTIHIEIVERVPFAIWQRGGELSVVDRDGFTITAKDVSRYATLPMVVGFGAAKHAPELLTLMQNQPVLLSRVRAFVFVGERRWNLRLENGVDVKLPENDVARALSDVVQLDAQYKIFSRDIQSVDLRLPDRVSIRLTSEGAAARGLATGAKLEMGQRQSGTVPAIPAKASASVGNET